MATISGELGVDHRQGRCLGVRRFSNAEKTARYRKNNPEKYKYNHIRYKQLYPEKYLFSLVKRRSNSRHIECNISELDIVIPEYCPLLNIKLDLLGDLDVHPSVDRIDPTKGYIKGNVMVISHRANRIKNNACAKELKLMAENLMKYEGGVS